MKCSIPCDDDCEAECHATHYVYMKKEHPDYWCQLSKADRDVALVVTAFCWRRANSERKYGSL